MFKADTIKANYVFKGEKIWRKINLGDKENYLVFNTNDKCSEISLFEILKFGVLEKGLNIFNSDNFGNAKNTVINPAQFRKLLLVSDSSNNTVFDENGNESKQISVVNRYLYGSDIKSYLLKENWILNSYSGQLEKRIIALAPLIYDLKQQKIVPLFWIYYQEWRELFSSFEAKNFRSNERISFEDVFAKRFFNSIIYKDNNVFDRTLNSIEKGNNFQLQNELIKEKINNLEEDLFQK